MPGAIFCLSLYHVCPAHSRKSVGSAGLHFGALSEEYPVWNDFLTFSTGFSTDFVKKKWGFPQCFPLFPPSFPQKIELWVIHDVFQNGKRGKIWGEKRSQSLFLKRKSRPKIYFLRRFALGAKAPLPSGILAQEFSTNAARQKPCVENREKTRVFHKLRREEIRSRFHKHCTPPEAAFLPAYRVAFPCNPSGLLRKIALSAGKNPRRSAHPAYKNSF